jgi:hypothetical protein
MPVYEYARKKSAKNKAIKVHPTGFIGLRTVVCMGTGMYKQRYFNFKTEDGLISKSERNRLRIEAELLNETWLEERKQARRDRRNSRNLRYNFYRTYAKTHEKEICRGVLRLSFCVCSERHQVKRSLTINEKNPFETSWKKFIDEYLEKGLISKKKSELLFDDMPDFDELDERRKRFNQKFPEAEITADSLRRIYG